MKKITAIWLVTSLCAPAFAQESVSEPMLVAPAVERAVLALPANTEVALRVNEMLTSKGNTYHEGDSFGLTVAQNILLEEYVVIPQGARATGRITWMTSKGAFGKSGKMEIAIEYVEVNGRRIPLEGTYRQEGEGNTVATVGGVVAAGILAGFITGRSAVIPQGRELVARTKQDVPIRIAAKPTSPPMRQVAPAEVRTAFDGHTERASSARVATRQARWGLVPVDAH